LADCVEKRALTAAAYVVSDLASWDREWFEACFGENARCEGR